MGPYFGPSIRTISTNTVCVENRLNIGRSKHLYCDETTGRYTITYEIYVYVCMFMPEHLQCILFKNPQIV